MFTQKILMDCTREQYDKYLKDELLKMGYDLGGAWGWQPSANTLTNFYNKNTGIIGCVIDNNRKVYNKEYLGEFNADLFLALAAMTDNPNGNYGEWWVYTSDRCASLWTFNKLYKQVWCITQERAFINDEGRQSGMHPNNKTYFRKATVEEIIANFGNKISPTVQIESTKYMNGYGEYVELPSITLTEQNAIELLKSKGYIITKQF